MLKKLPYWDNPYNDISDWQILKKISIEQTQTNKWTKKYSKKKSSYMYFFKRWYINKSMVRVYGGVEKKETFNDKMPVDLQ